MRKRIYVILFILGLVTALGSAWLQTSPGYMDAYYYYYGGAQLANGQGFTEMFLWNYLDNPSGLPHAGFSYWMPLTSFSAAVGIKLFAPILGMFRGAQLIFVLIAACIPPLTAALAWEISKEKRVVWFSGILAAFMGYFQPFVVAVDAFGIYMLLGGLFFLVALRKSRYRYILLGILVGLMHLARADGLLWLAVAGLVVLIDQLQRNPSPLRKPLFSKFVILNGLAILSSYLLIMTPWFWRNNTQFGTLLSPGAGKTFWVLDYDELFSYPADLLTFSRWWGAGFLELLRIRLDAFLVNLQSTVASLGMIFPGVLALLGFYRWRQEKLVKIGGAYWLLLLFVMTLIFPFAGMRGGFFHSGAALMPLVWVMVPHGLNLLTEWSVKAFKWETRKIQPFYTGLLFFYVLVFSLATLYSSIIGTDPRSVPLWNLTERQYMAVEEALENISADPAAVIVSATPPAYTAITGRPAIAMPDGGLEPLLGVIDRYNARYVLVEENHPDELEELFLYPADFGGLEYLTTVEGVHLFIWEGN